MAAIIVAVGVGTAVGSQANAMLRDSIDQLSSGAPIYIRDGQPQSAVATIGQIVARHACRKYAAGEVGQTNPKAAKYEQACRPYLTSIGLGIEPAIKLPFRSGLCAGVPYNLTFEVRNRTSSVSTCQAFSAWRNGGGIIGFGSINGPIGSAALVSVFSNDFTSTNRKIELIVTRGASTFKGNLDGAATRYWHTNCGPSYEVRNIRWVRATGVGECGDPPAEVIEGEPVPDPNPRPRVFNPDTGTDIDVDTTINVDGSITFNIGTGPITIDPFGDGDDDGSGGPAITPGDVGEPGTPTTAIGGESAGDAGIDAEGQAPPGKVLTGVKMMLQTAPAAPSQFKIGVYRGSVYIYMGTASGLDLDYAGQMMSNNQFVFAEKDNLTHWKISANPGYSWQVTPFYKEV